MTSGEDILRINTAIISRGKQVYDETVEFSKSPKTSEELLFTILRDNQDTEYGRLHNFADVHTLDDYRKKVPLSTFDEYAEYVAREIMNGEKKLHCAYELKQYNRSSGTMGNPKKIPMSKKSMEMFLDRSVILPFGVAAKELGDDFADGKILSVMEASALAYIGDIRYCGVSAQQVLDVLDKYSEIFTSPREASCPDKSTDSRYLHARYGLAEKNVVCLHSSFSTFILDLFHYIGNNWEMLCNDIESGKIDPSVKMTDEIRSKLESELVPMPERAQELRKIFSEGIDSKIAKKIWPNLAFMNAVCTGAFSAYLKNLRENYTGDVPVCYESVCASEGAFCGPLSMNCSDFVPYGNTMFFEFLPLGEEDQEKTLTLDSLKIGEEYEMIVTTCSGLYRYRTRDAYRVTGKFNEVPTLEYLYRMDMCVNLNGEKTYEPALRKAVDLTAEEIGFKYLDFCVYPDTDMVPSCYRFFIEMTERPKKTDLNEIAKSLQKNLCIANPMLIYKFERSLCGPVVAHILQDETYLLYRDKLIMKGGASTQVKPVKIIMNEAQLRFFRILIDKEAE